MIRVVVVVAMLLALSTAAAADNKLRAVALFNEGIKQMKAGNYEGARDLFEQSNKLYPDSGTQGSLARCYEKLGKVATSWKLWTELSSTAPEKLRPDAAANAEKLEPRLPKYVLRMSSNAPGFALTVDGAKTDVKADTPTPIDPGKHALVVRAVGYAEWSREFTAVEGKTEELTVELRPETAKPIDPNPIKPIETQPSSTKRKLGFALMGVGGALVLGGGVFGIIAKGRNDDAKDICGGDIDACDPVRLPEAQDKVDSARTAGNISTVGFLVGGAAIVTGVVLFVTAPKAKTQIAITPTSVLLTRNF